MVLTESLNVIKHKDDLWTYDRTTDSLEAIRDTLDSLSVGSGFGARTVQFTALIAQGTGVSDVLNDDPTIFQDPVPNTSSTSYVPLKSYSIDVTHPATKSIRYVLMDLSWDTEITGTGSKLGLTKWQAKGSGSSWVDITSEVSGSSTFQIHHLSGALKKAEMNYLPLEIRLLGKVFDGEDSLSSNIRSTTEVTITYNI